MVAVGTNPLTQIPYVNFVFRFNEILELRDGFHLALGLVGIEPA